MRFLLQFENIHATMSGTSVFHILFGSCIALLFVLNTPVSGDFKYERTIAFTVERTADMSESITSRDIGAFNKNSQKIYLNIGEALDVVTGRFKGKETRRERGREGAEIITCILGPMCIWRGERGGKGPQPPRIIFCYCIVLIKMINISRYDSLILKL